MNDIPDSYEDIQAIIDSRKKKRRKTMLRSLLIAIISILALFLIWLFYPVSAPDYTLRALLPANTAFSVELRHPRALLKTQQKNHYLDQISGIPVWPAFEREYSAEFLGKSLQNDIRNFIRELSETADDLLGMRNIIAATGGISYRKDNTPVYSAAVWLDNIGVLSARVSTYVKPPKTFKGLKYYKSTLNSRESLYIALTPLLPRTVLFSTDLESLGNFQLTPDTRTDNEFSTRDDIIEASVFPHNIPRNSSLNIPDITGGELKIRWSPTDITASGALTLAKVPLSLPLESNSPKNIQLTSSNPSLALNLQLPQQTGKQALLLLLQTLRQNEDPFSKVILQDLDPAVFTQIKDRFALLLTEPQTPDSFILRHAHLYLQTGKTAPTQKALAKTLSSIITAGTKSSELSVRLLSSQLKIETAGKETILSLPFIPKVSATCERLAATNYAEIKLQNTPPYPPVLAESPVANTAIIDTVWRYSPMLTGSIASSIPPEIQDLAIVHITQRHKILVKDLINFLASANFFSLCIQANFDNKNNTQLKLEARLQLLRK